MRRWLFITLGIIGALAAAAVGGVVLFTQTDWGRERVRRLALDAIQGAAHGVVRVGRVRGNLLKGITVDGFSITDSAGNPFLAAEEVTARYALRNFISKRIYLDDVRLVRPVIVLDRPPGGVWNYERVFPGDSTPTDTTKGPGFGSWIRLTDTEVVDGRVLVRIPWQPDSVLTAAQRDSSVRAALAGDTRLKVIPTSGGGRGYQQVSEFTRLTGRFPELRIADPETDVTLVRVARLQTIAAPFLPPVATVQDLAGAFELDGDSVWFQGVRARFPSSQAVISGRYAFDSGDLALRARANPAAFADLRFVLPALPDSGGGRMDFGLNWAGGLQRYVGQDVDVRTGATTIAGQFGVDLVGEDFALHKTNVRFEALDSDLIARLFPGLALPRPGVLTGRALADGTADTLRLDADVTFDDRTAGRNRVVAVGEIGFDSASFRARDLRVTLAPAQVALATVPPAPPAAPPPRQVAGAEAGLREQRADAREAAVALPIGGTVAGRFVLDGSTTGTLTARAVDLTHLDRGRRSRVTGDALVRLGAKPYFLDVDLVARPLALATVGRFAPAAGLRGSATGPIRARGTLRDLAVDSRLAVTGGGAIAAKGRLDLASAETGYDLAVDARLFNANAVAEKAPRTRVTATARARGRGFDPATMRLDAAADVATSQFDTLGVDAATLRVNVANGLARLDTLGATIAGARVAASGQFGLRAGQTGEIVYRVAADSLEPFRRYLPRDTTTVAPRPAVVAEAVRRARADSAALDRATETQRLITGAPAPRLVVDTPSTVRRDSLAGAAYAAGVVRGSLERFDLRGRLGLQGFVGFGSAAKEARVEYAWTEAGTSRGVLAVAARADSVLAGGFALDSVDARALHRASEAGFATGTGTAQVSVFQDYAREYSVRADYRASPEENEVRFADMRLRFDSTTWATTRPGAVRFGARGVVVDTLELTSGPLRRIFVNGLLPTEGEADATIAVSNFELKDALSLAQSDLDLEGAVSVAARLDGTLRAPRLHGAVGLAAAEYNGSPLLDVRGTFDYAAERLTARAEGVRGASRPYFTATAALPVNLALQGATGPRLPEGRELQAELTLDSLPLTLLPRLSAAVTGLRGTANGRVTVAGALPRPTITGALAVDSAAAGIEPLGITLEQVAARVRVARDTVVIDSVVGRSGGGTLGVTGRIGIADPARPSFNVQFRTEKARLLNNEQGRIVADAQIAAFGPYDGVRVSGGVLVRNGVIYLPESDGKNVQTLSATDPRLFAVADTALLRDQELVAAPNALVDNLQLNLNVNVNRDVWVRSGEANVEVYTDGDLTVGIDRRLPDNPITVAGVVNSERGQYEFQGRRFEITRGQATFLGGPEIDAALQATAEYEVAQSQQALVIRLLIGGTVSSPRLSLESNSQPPISQSDLIAYLAFGRSSSSLLQQGGSSVSGGGGGGGGGLTGATSAFVQNQFTGVALGVLVDQFEKSVARSLRADVLNVTTGDVPLTANASGVQSLLYSTEIEYGRYLNNRSFLGVVARPDPATFATTGIGLRYQYRVGNGYQLETTYQPRYQLDPPSLELQRPDALPVFGLFLIREWRF